MSRIPPLGRSAAEAMFAEIAQNLRSQLSVTKNCAAEDFALKQFLVRRSERAASRGFA